MLVHPLQIWKAKSITNLQKFTSQITKSVRSQFMKIIDLRQHSLSTALSKVDKGLIFELITTYKKKLLHDAIISNCDMVPEAHIKMVTPRAHS